MSQVRKLADRFATLADMLRDPNAAERVRSFFYCSAIYDGLSEADADDGAQLAMERLLSPTPRLATLAPAHALYAVRRYLRRSGWKPQTGKARRSMRARALTPDQWAGIASGGMSDNPATLAAAMETAQALAMTACGRHAKALRALSMADIRALACPDMRGEGSIDPGVGSRKPIPQRLTMAGLSTAERRDWAHAAWNRAERSAGAYDPAAAADAQRRYLESLER